MNLPIDEKLQGNILTPPKRDEGPMYTKKGTLRKRRPKTKNQYFTADTEEAILEYLKETDEKKRNEIYNERIFTMAVLDINGDIFTQGEGTSKKKAEQSASKLALIKLNVIEDY